MVQSIKDILLKYGQESNTQTKKDSQSNENKPKLTYDKLFDLFCTDEKKYYEELENWQKSNNANLNQQKKVEEEEIKPKLNYEDEFESFRDYKNDKGLNYVFTKDLQEMFSNYGTKIPAIIYFVNGYFNYCKNKAKPCYLTKQQIFKQFNREVSISTIKAAIRILKQFGLSWQKRFLKSFRECKYEIVWTKKDEEYNINKVWIDFITEKFIQLNEIGELNEKLSKKQISKKFFVKKKKAIRKKSSLNFTFRCWATWFHKFKKLSILRTQIYQDLKAKFKIPKISIAEVLKGFEINTNKGEELNFELDMQSEQSDEKLVTD